MRAIGQRAIKKVPALRGRMVVNLFFEASTRTRFSFETAEKWLSADSLNFAAKGSSVEKGESLLDTARNLQAMSPDLIVIRHGSPGRAALPGAAPEGRRRQRGRRRARAPDAGAARRADDPPAARAARGPQRHDRRRHRPFARRPLEHLAADEDGREGHRLRAADAAAAADRGDGGRGHDRLRRRARGRRRRDDAAHAARAAGQVALPVDARVLPALRARRASGCPAPSPRRS